MAEGPDKGRAWLIAAAAFVINVIMSGIFRAQGLLFVEFINQFGVHRKEASMPFSIQSAVRNLCAPVAGILGQKYGAPAVIITGGILASISSAFCYFTTDILWITIMWGGLNGFASALSNVLPQVVVAQYFIKHRTTATGLAWSGSSISAFFFPVIVEVALFSYGLHGTFIILSGLMMHIIPAGMLLKKPSWLTNTTKQHNIDNVLQKCNKMQNEEAPSKKCKVPLNSEVSCDFRITSVNDKIHDKDSGKKLVHDADVKNNAATLKRSSSQDGLLHQVQMNNLQRSSMFPAVSSVELNCRTFSSNPEYVFDVDIDYLKRHSELMFHMLSMEIPNVETSYRAILLEIEQDDLWHPDENEMLKEIENIYYHIEKSFEMDEISSKSQTLNGPHLKRRYLSEALSMNKKTESLRVVKRYLKTYKERGLQQLGKIRSAPNMCSIYNEIARKDYVISKLKQLNNANEIRIISHLCQFNPKAVLRVLFQLRTLYNIYNDVECCETGESSELEETDAQEGNVLEKSTDTFKQKSSNSEADDDAQKNSFKVHIKAALYLHAKPIFLLICVSRAAFSMTFIPIYTTIVDFAVDKGFESSEGKYVIAVMSLGDLLGRLCLGWITDRGYASLSRYMVLGMTSLGISLICIPLMYSKWAIFLSITIMGMIQGSLFIRHPVLITKYLEPHQQSIAMGCSEFSCGVLTAILPLYIGFFRDKLGFYDPMYFLNGAIVILCGLVWHFEPLIIKEK